MALIDFIRLFYGMEVIIKTLSIKNDYEFRRVYKKGRSFVNAALVVYILKNRKNMNRVGITTSRKIGNAVKRNRARRIIREAYRQYEEKLPDGYDFVFVARTRTCSLKTQNIARVMGGVLASAKLLENNRTNV
jgi:ribonuclease P protein component